MKLVKVLEYRHKLLKIITKILKNSNFKFFTFVMGLLVSFSVIIVSIEKYTNDSFENYFDGLWWTIVTISTVGYGDLYPGTTAGRIAGLFIIVFGICIMGIITGKITSFLVEKQIKEGKGLVDISHLSGHFIICGWRLNMKEFLLDTLKINKKLISEKIVLVNNQNAELIDNLRSEDQLKDVNFVSGDFVDETTLLRANIKKAARALILADRTNNISPEETDARTVMTVYTIESLNKKCYTCAEILNAKFRPHLENSNCDEIVLSAEYAQMLLTNASSASGISHIISQLFSPEADSRLITTEYPISYSGKTFKELRDYFYRLDGSILIGILENAGNIFEYKREALRNAQKTPDISQLVRSLKEVKNIKSNEPILNPGNNYIIKKHSKAILIEPNYLI